MTKGWHKQSARHSLAARGLKTRIPYKFASKGASPKYQVVVGNIGTVYSGNNKKEAQKAYRDYVEISKGVYGRGAQEQVIMFEKDTIAREYAPPDYEEQERGSTGGMR